MNIYDRIINALDNDKENNILTFNGHIIEEKLGKGQQGAVLKIKNKIGKRFALKLYHPTDTDPDILKKGVDRFIQEVLTSASFNHKNIVKIYTGGVATWDERGKRWCVSEGFEGFEKQDMKENHNISLYYIMDYIKGNDISSIFPELYFICWDDVPGKDSKRLLEHLEKDLMIDWAKNAKIEENDANRITVTDGENSLSLKLDKRKNKAILEIIGGGTYEYILKDENGKLNIYLKYSKEIPIYERLKPFEDLISQISNAINYYHAKGITHKDIKPDNIRFSTEDSTFIIVDFGFARHIASPQDYSTIPRTEYLDTASIEAQDYLKNDMGQFCKILLKILPSFEDEYDDNRYKGIESALKKGVNANLKNRYENIEELYNSIKHYFLTELGWKFELKLNEYLSPNRFGRFGFKLRLPVSGSILLSEEVRAIIDTPEFQRLRGNRQLGPAIFVFPGANHTRFEHSLGTYFLSLKYLEKLLSLPAFKELCEPIEDSIKLIILSALLHDIGHYPYSHWIEEIDEFPRKIKFPNHEERAKRIICTGKIRKLVKNLWGVDVEILSNVIANRQIENEKVLINSIINSIIDVDKLDYLVRDSIHCGVNYGKGIDTERVLDSLYVNQEINKICLTEKGRSCLLSILSCRNIMYQEVYWHKTVRSCNAMFKRFFFEYIKEEVDEIETVYDYFDYSDDQFISKLSRQSKDKDFNKLISPFSFRKGRLLYKPAYVFFHSNASMEPTDTQNFFGKLFDMPYKDIMDLSDTLAGLLKEHIPNIEPLDIILETTPIKSEHEKYDLRGFKIWNTKKSRFEDYLEINALNVYLENNKQAYIFCNPKYYGDFKKLAAENKLNKILGKI